MSDALAGVVFDCDGVLVNSEELAFEAWAEALRGHGYETVDEELHSRIGISRAENLAWYAARAGIDDLDAFHVGLQDALARLFAARLRAYPDTEGTLRALHGAGVPVAVASNSTRADVELRLDATGLLGLVDDIVGLDDVARPKPAPDVYLAAAARLGTPPARTVAVEDSAHGVRAARAAGLPVLGVSRIPGREGDLDAADLVVDAVDVAALRRLAGSDRGPDVPYDPPADD